MQCLGSSASGVHVSFGGGQFVGGRVWGRGGGVRFRAFRASPVHYSVSEPLIENIRRVLATPSP